MGCQNIARVFTAKWRRLGKVAVRSKISTWRAVLAVNSGVLHEEKNYWIVNPILSYKALLGLIKWLTASFSEDKKAKLIRWPLASTGLYKVRYNLSTWVLCARELTNSFSRVGSNLWHLVWQSTVLPISPSHLIPFTTFTQASLQSAATHPFKAFKLIVDIELGWAWAWASPTLTCWMQAVSVYMYVFM